MNKTWKLVFQIRETRFLTTLNVTIFNGIESDPTNILTFGTTRSLPFKCGIVLVNLGVKSNFFQLLESYELLIWLMEIRGKD